ncbi:MAG: molybdopterin-dependent oxidoreductase [Dehalococcoidia bacterium]
MFVASNNPAVTCPDSARVAAGLARADLFTVVHDPFLSDTARYADIVLPACTALETEDFYRSYGTYYVQYGPRVIAPLGESRSNLWLAQELARRLGLDDPVFRRTPREHMQEALAGATGPTAALTVERLVKGGPVKLPVRHDGPAVTRFHAAELADMGLPPLPEWAPDPAEADAPSGSLRLLTLPGHFQHHTAFAAVEALQRRQGPPSCVLHPQDAAAHGIGDGAVVELVNALGRIALRAHVSDDTQPGVVTVEGSRARSRFAGGGPLNVLVTDRLTDLGGGATYQSTWVTVRPAP